MFHIKDYVSCPQQTSMDYYKVIYAMQWFLASDFFVSQSQTKCQIFLFCVIFGSWSFPKNDQHWKTFQMLWIWLCLEIFFFFCPTYQLLRHNILYLTWYLIFPAFWSHSILLKIGKYTNSNLMIYNLIMFGKIIFALTVNYDIIGI